MRWKIAELIDLVEMEVRELLKKLQVPGRRCAGGPRLGAGRAERRSPVGSARSTS